MHRLVSSVIIWRLTSKWYYAVAQWFELMMIKAIMTNYKLSTDEPSNGQRYLCLLESLFESTPQLIIAGVFIVRTWGVYDESDPTSSGSEWILISFIASLWSLSTKVISDDKYTLREEWRSLKWKRKKCKECRCINWRYMVRAFAWRFSEITARFDYKSNLFLLSIVK